MLVVSVTLKTSISSIILHFFLLWTLISVIKLSEIHQVLSKDIFFLWLCSYSVVECGMTFKLPTPAPS